MKLILSPVFFFFCSAFAVNAQFQNPMDEIQKSHIEANVPSEDSFNSILNRDLTLYFQPKFENVKIAVSYDLLRTAPTQSGVSYPKYYAWVKVKSEKGTILVEGAVRLAAIETVRFDVTDFISAKEVQVAPEKLDTVFPRALIANIKNLAV